MQNVASILAPADSFMVLNLYSNGFSAVLGETVVRQAFGLFQIAGYESGPQANDALQTAADGNVCLDSGELVLCDRSGKRLPLSIFVRMRR